MNLTAPSPIVPCVREETLVASFRVGRSLSRRTDSGLPVSAASAQGSRGALRFIVTELAKCAIIPTIGRLVLGFKGVRTREELR